MSLVDESDELHSRVRGFARGQSEEDFSSLALKIADFQVRWSEGHQRLRDSRGGALNSVDDIPAVPAAAFRMTRVAVHPPELDSVRFSTSGTTSGERGVHAMRTTTTYECLSTLWGERAFSSAPRRVVALAADSKESSLGFMFRVFMRRFDGPDAPERWLMSADGIDLAALESARDTDRSVLVLATSFALVSLLDALPGSTLSLPKASIVMQTGGFKGKTREVEPQALRENIAHTFGIAESSVVSEYGMTELTSQLYDFTLDGGTPGLYRPPPWLRVTAVDPVTLERLGPEQTGLARFVDLGNVDSAVAVVTQDLVRVTDTGLVELVGRQPGAIPRGCSLAVDELLGTR